MAKKSSDTERCRAKAATCVLGALLVSLAAAGSARAQQDAMRLEYRAAAGCPTADAFAAAVRARAIGGGNLRRHAVDVQITAGKTFEGRVVVTHEDGTTANRELRGATCADLASALALAVATALEPDDDAALGPATPSTPAPEAPTSSPAASAEAKAPSPPPSVSAYAPVPRGIQLSAGAEMAAALGVGPTVTPEIALFADIAFAGPSARLAVARAVSASLDTSAGSALFTRVIGRAEGCPLRWERGSLRLVPCVAFELGSLSATGSETSNPESSSRVWAAAGLVGRLGWGIAGPIVAEAEIRASVPIVRDNFLFRPNHTVYSVPVVTGSVGLTIGARFW